MTRVRIETSPDDRTLCVVIHDVAPPTRAACEWMLGELAALGTIPVTLLAVPAYHGCGRDAGFEHWLRDRAAQGDEVALHGWRHLDDGTPRGTVDRLRRNVYTRGEGEFWSLDRAEATRRIEAGLAWLHDLGLTPEGFVAPAWLLGPGAWDALREQPFRYTCTLGGIHLLAPGSEPREVPCQSQVYSSSTAWRRQLSVIWNESLGWWQRDRRIVRLELHPTDDTPMLHRSWKRLAARQLADRQVRTVADLVRRLRTEPARRST